MRTIWVGKSSDGSFSPDQGDCASRGPYCRTKMGLDEQVRAPVGDFCAIAIPNVVATRWPTATVVVSNYQGAE